MERNRLKWLKLVVFLKLKYVKLRSLFSIYGLQEVVIQEIKTRFPNQTPYMTKVESNIHNDQIREDIESPIYVDQMQGLLWHLSTQDKYSLCFVIDPEEPP
jgi:hypothetical protein